MTRSTPRLPEHLELLLTEEAGPPVLDVYAYGPWRAPDGLYEGCANRGPEGTPRADERTLPLTRR